MFMKKMNGLLALSVAVVGLVGCGGGAGIDGIDIADYMPNQNMIKEYEEKKKVPGEVLTSRDIVETITVSTVDGHRVIVQEQGASIEKHIINEDNVSTYGNGDVLKYASERYVALGDITIFKQMTLPMLGDNRDITIECKIEDKINSFLTDPAGAPIYTGDMILVACTIRTDEPVVLDGVSYNYDNHAYYVMKRDIGLVGRIDLNCYVDPDNRVIDDSNYDTCPAIKRGSNIMIWDNL